MNVALPAIADDLDAGISGPQWTVSAYTVVLAALLMFAGSVADRLGRKRTFLSGLTVFRGVAGLQPCAQRRAPGGVPAYSRRSARGGRGRAASIRSDRSW